MLVLSSIHDPQLPKLLANGAVGVLPTDTIYGLAALAADAQAVAQMAAVKRGEQHYRPGTVIAASTDQLIDLGVDEAVVRRVAHLWPNPLSIELPLGENLAHLYQEGAHRAFRVTASPELRRLLEQTGPLLTTSANLHGEPPANTLAETQAYFGDNVDFYVDGGDLSHNLPSTIARLHADGRLEVLRPGAVAIDETGQLAQNA